MTESHILCAYSFKNPEKPIELKVKEAALSLKNEGLCWVHLDVNNPKTSYWLKKEVSYLDQIVIDALLADETRPRITEYKDGAIIILRGVNLKSDSEPEDMVSIRMWVDSGRIITMQRRNIKGIHDIEARIKSEKSFKDAGEFVAELCCELFGHLQSVIDNLDDRTVDIEEKILDKPHSNILRENVITAKKQIIMIRRHIAPQKDVINRLKNCQQNWLAETDRRSLQESYENLSRYIDDLDEINERAQVVHDEMANSINRKLNKNMYVLSVIAAIFMPLNFIASLFGMNVGGVPLGDNNQGFWLVSGILTALIIIQLIISSNIWRKN